MRRSAKESEIRRPAAAGLLLAAALASGLGAAAQEPGPDPECAADAAADLRRICERGELRVARYGGERPPFFFSDADGTWAGFDVDLGRDIAARLGVAYREDNSPQSFDAVVERVASGEADIGLSKLSATLDRARRVRFTRPYLTVYQALLVNRLSMPGGGDPFELLDAEGVTIGALAGTSYVPYAERSFPAASVAPYDEFVAMMNAVAAGTLDAALMDSARANAWRRANRERLIQIRTHVDKTRKDSLAIAVGWADTHLLAWLDLYLEKIRADGTAEALYQQWFGAGSEGGVER